MIFGADRPRGAVRLGGLSCAGPCQRRCDVRAVEGCSSLMKGAATREGEGGVELAMDDGLLTGWDVCTEVEGFRCYGGAKRGRTVVKAAWLSPLAAARLLLTRTNLGPIVNVISERIERTSTVGSL